MIDRPHTDRCLEVARELRAAAEETRRALQASRDVVRRSREQSAIAAGPGRPGDGDLGPSKHLVECLIEAYEAAQGEADAQTRVLLGQVLHHVGRRVARALGPKATGIAVH